jgi:hypothetical protein
MQLRFRYINIKINYFSHISYSIILFFIKIPHIFSLLPVLISRNKAFLSLYSRIKIMERQEGKLRAKEALRSLCQIADSQRTGKVPWTEFRVFLNRCQIHLHELTLKSIQDKLISASLPYSPFIDHIDFNSTTSRWFLRPFLSSTTAPCRPHPTRQDLLHAMYLHIAQSS